MPEFIDNLLKWINDNEGLAAWVQAVGVIASFWSRFIFLVRTLGQPEPR